MLLGLKIIRLGVYRFAFAKNLLSELHSILLKVQFTEKEKNMQLACTDDGEDHLIIL